MMKYIVKWIVAGLLVVWSMASFAGSQFAVIDMQKVFHESAQVKAMGAKLQKQSAADQKEMQGLAKKLESNMQDLKKNQSVYSKKKAAALTQSIKDQEVALHGKQAQFQKTLYAAQNDAMHAFMVKVQGVVSSIAKKKNYDLVLPKNAVVYAGSGADITDQVIKALN